MQRRAVALFSGGLDSILAAKLIQEQGLELRCLHFVSPFFGKPEKIRHWRKVYGLEIEPVDIGGEFTAMLARRPVYGFGSVLNPCVDCKILMLRHARAVMEDWGACCVISGEVLGQRPMSQRRDTLNIIRRDADLKGRLLRPLCARHMDPTDAELEGLVDRSRLPGISGRGRKEQRELAARFGISEIPTPAGGCRLAEQENARSYWPVLAYTPSPAAADFQLANTGRQYWHDQERAGLAGTADGPGNADSPVFRLIIGRGQEDNERLMALAGERDWLFKARDFPGPVALGRFFGGEWPEEALLSAAAFSASYSGKAARHAEEQGAPVAVRAHRGSLDAPGRVLEVRPCRHPAFAWREYPWPEARDGIRADMAGRGWPV